MRCQEFREIADSYLSDELLIETNHEVLRHLESCLVCRQELAARRDLRGQLRSAVKNNPVTQINRAFEIRLRQKLREQILRPTVWARFKSGAFGNPAMWAATATACLLITVLLGGFWQRSARLSDEIAVKQNSELIEPQNPLQLESTDSVAVRAAWTEISRQAAGDHKNCALKFNLAEKPITLVEAAEKYGRFHRDLEQAVIKPLRAVFGDKIKLVEAHSCVFAGRRFAHVVLKQRDKIISVLVTDAELKNETDDAITCESNDKMRVACFHTEHHAIFVVSDMLESENLLVARTISPAVRLHIEKTERAA